MLEEEPLPAMGPVVMQVSRWDQLKDPVGVLGAFSGHVANRSDAHLLLVGPSTAAVADDPEGAQVLDAVRAAWHELPERSAGAHTCARCRWMTSSAASSSSSSARTTLDATSR